MTPRLKLMSENLFQIPDSRSTPLGAGDLIDRAVRFYRGNFWTFVWIAAPPIVVGTIISVAWTMVGRKLFFGEDILSPDVMFFYTAFNWFGGIIIWLMESIATLTVMGGASRNFVRHLLFGEPITFGETYKNVRKKLGQFDCRFDNSFDCCWVLFV